MTWLEGLGRFLLWLARPEQRVADPARTSSEAPGDPIACELALSEPIRAIEGQRKSLDELRARAGILLSTALIVGALLGGPASNTDSVWSVIIAAGFLVVTVGLALVILRPTGGWKSCVERRSRAGECDDPADADAQRVRGEVAA